MALTRCSAIRESGRDVVSHVPFFSRGAAFLLDAIAALPRKSDPGGAASLPWQTIALVCDGASREFGKMTLRRFSFGSAAKVLDDDDGEERDGVEVGFGFGDGYDFAIVGCTCDLEGVANEAAPRVAIEDKSLQLIICKSAIGEVNLICVVSSAALPVVMPEMRLSDHLCYWDKGFPALMLTDNTAPCSGTRTTTSIPTPWKR